jgi:hypothetical protein
MTQSDFGKAMLAAGIVTSALEGKVDASSDRSIFVRPGYYREALACRGNKN